MNDSRPQLKALTGLRFVAAMHVVLYHCGGPMLVGFPWWIRNLASSGYVGVSLFFVLSGFILTYTYLGHDRERRFDVRSFWAARFARIYPVYLLGFALAAPYTIRAALAAHHGSKAFGWLAAYAVAALSLTQAWSPYTAIAWNTPAWSLSVEAFFYLVFPFAAVWLAKWLRGQPVLPVAAVIWASSMIPPVAYILINPDHLQNPLRYAPFVPWLSVMKFCPLTRLPEFLLGVVLGHLYLSDLSVGRTRPGPAIIWLATAGILVGLELSNRLPYPIVHNALLAPLFALLILGLAHGGGLIASILSRPLLVLLGEASYALYILHLNSWPWAMRFIGFAKPGAVSIPWAAFTLYLAIMLPVTVFVFFYIETPARKWLRRLLSPKAGTIAVPG